MKKLYNKNNGITLVALVVTIIILLILAGISIAQLTGNGLFEKAKLAKEKQENAQIEEDATLSEYENEIGKYVDGNRDTVTIPKEEYEMLKNRISYSKDEKVIGTWIDGKPLYQKTIEGTTPESINTWATVISLGTTCIIKDINGYFTGPAGNSFKIGYYDSNAVLEAVLNNGVNGDLSIFTTTSNFTNRPFVINIQYVKTTD